MIAATPGPSHTAFCAPKPRVARVYGGHGEKKKASATRFELAQAEPIGCHVLLEEFKSNPLTTRAHRRGIL